MGLPSFLNDYILTISEALDVAEDKTGDFFKFSLGQWKRHHYDIKTQSDLKDQEIAPHAFALLNKYEGTIDGREIEMRKRDFYFICLQDYQIEKALEKDKNLILLPLLIYIFTHELVHIVRFCNFHQRFEISGLEREREEVVVHGITYQILKNLSLPKLDYTLESYRDHRICDLALS